MKQMQSTYTWLKFLYTYVGIVLFIKNQEQINLDNLLGLALEV